MTTFASDEGNLPTRLPLRLDILRQLHRLGYRPSLTVSIFPSTYEERYRFWEWDLASVQRHTGDFKAEDHDQKSQWRWLMRYRITICMKDLQLPQPTGKSVIIGNPLQKAEHLLKVASLFEKLTPSWDNPVEIYTEDNGPPMMRGEITMPLLHADDIWFEGSLWRNTPTT